MDSNQKNSKKVNDQTDYQDVLISRMFSKFNIKIEDTEKEHNNNESLSYFSTIQINVLKAIFRINKSSFINGKNKAHFSYVDLYKQLSFEHSDESFKTINNAIISLNGKWLSINLTNSYRRQVKMIETLDIIDSDKKRHWIATFHEGFS